MTKSINDNIIVLHPAPLDVLVEASEEDLRSVIVIGCYSNGEIYFNSSIPKRAEVNYILDMVKLDILTQ